MLIYTTLGQSNQICLSVDSNWESCPRTLLRLYKLIEANLHRKAFLQISSCWSKLSLSSAEIECSVTCNSLLHSLLFCSFGISTLDQNKRKLKLIWGNLLKHEILQLSLQNKHFKYCFLKPSLYVKIMCQMVSPCVRVF